MNLYNTVELDDAEFKVVSCVTAQQLWFEQTY